MNIELITVCDFKDIWDTTAPGQDNLSAIKEPVNKVGHLRADHDGYRWHSSYFPCNEHLKTNEVKSEMNMVSRYLTESLFAGKSGRDILFDYCASHPEAKVKYDSDEYNFFFNGQHANYWIRINARLRDYQLYLHTFAKKLS